MKLGIMQPYFFPYIGYYDLINRTDRWVVFDVVQYNAKSWMSRNRILHPANGWQYIGAPVDKHVGTGNISEVLVVDKTAAQRRILGQVEHYRHARAPFFSKVRVLIERAFEDAHGDSLCDLNVSTLRVTCEYLGIPFNYIVLSKSAIELPAISHPGQWALEISTALGAAEYVNPPNGRHLFRQHEFDERGIKLTITDLVDYRYSCEPYEFVEHLSIVDVLMWNDPRAVKAYLDERRAL